MEDFSFSWKSNDSQLITPRRQNNEENLCELKVNLATSVQ